MSGLSDQHRIDFTFEDLEIEVDGVFFGYFDGVAELAVNAPDEEEFYVKQINVAGAVKVKRWRSYGYSYYDRNEGMLTLDRPQASDTSFKAGLFRKLEAAINSDPDAQEAWAAEVEWARENDQG